MFLNLYMYFQAPNPEDVLPFHFVAFVCKDGCLYELGKYKNTTIFMYFVLLDKNTVINCY